MSETCSCLPPKAEVRMTVSSCQTRSSSKASAHKVVGWVLRLVRLVVAMSEAVLHVWPEASRPRSPRGT
jgi:hypothetical protein